MTKKPPALEIDDLEVMMTTVGNQDANDPNLVDEITVRVCATWPGKAYQASVKFRDRTLPWGTFVHRDPLMAQMCALHIALRGPSAVKAESTAMFHKSKDKASDVAAKLRADYPGILVASKVELEPLHGWVAVVFTKKGYDPLNLKELAGIAEVREIEDLSEPPRRRSGSAPKFEKVETPEPQETPDRVGSKAKKAKPAAPSAPAGDRSSMTKSALIKEHQQLFGKQPNNKLSREEIIEMIESKLAAQGATSEEDDLM